MHDHKGGIVMQLQKILQDFTREASKIYGSHLVKIVLYGSYARGDFQDDSDIDLLVLVDVDDGRFFPTVDKKGGLDGIFRH